MRPKKLALAAAIAAIPGSAALGAGLMHGADGRELSIEAQELRVSVEGPVATTEVLQTFKNASDEPTEAVYDFALPPRATFSGLSIWVDGKEVQGEVVERRRAEEAYSEVTGVKVAAPDGRATEARELGVTAPPRADILRIEGPFVLRRRDPALLEARSGRELRLRVAPVPARGTQKVRIRYVEPIDVQAGEGRYTFPVAKGSPLDAAVVLRGRVADASWERFRAETLIANEAVKIGGTVARCQRDVDVRFRLAPQEAPTIDVARGKKAALVTLTPWLPQMASVPRDVVFVVDASETMRATSRTAKAALHALVKDLRLQDRFGVVAFNLAARSYKDHLVAASADERGAALEFIEETAFELGDDPRTALVATAKLVRKTDSPRPLDVVLLTGPAFSESDELVRAVEAEARASGARIFALELGSDAPQAPLARLCERTGGTARCKDAAALARLLAAPSLRAPSLRFEGVALSQVEPAEPPAALRDGTPVALAALVEKPGHGDAILEGTLADGRRMSWTIPFEVPEKGDMPDVDRIWAQRSADAVLAALARKDLEANEQARLEKELVRVSVAGPILTKATSLIVLESEAMFEEFGIARDNKARVAEERAAQEERRVRFEAEVEGQRRKLEAKDADVVARAERPAVWKAPTLGAFGGVGHGGGAGEPIFVLVALGLAAHAFARPSARKTA